MTPRERAMLRRLVLALGHIQSELNAAGVEEVRQHPMLRDKQRFVDQSVRQIKKWEDED